MLQDYSAPDMAGGAEQLADRIEEEEEGDDIYAPASSISQAPPQLLLSMGLMAKIPPAKSLPAKSPPAKSPPAKTPPTLTLSLEQDRAETEAEAEQLYQAPPRQQRFSLLPQVPGRISASTNLAPDYAPPSLCSRRSDATEPKAKHSIQGRGAITPSPTPTQKTESQQGNNPMRLWLAPVGDQALEEVRARLNTSHSAQSRISASTKKSNERYVKYINPV